MTRHFLAYPLGGGLLLLALATPLPAQPSAPSTPQPFAEEIEAAKAAQAASKPDSPDGKSAKPSEGKPEKEREKDGEKDGEKKEGNSNAVKRPENPGFTVDPKELDLKPVDGKIRFNFHGQPWQGVLEWYAAISGQSLDWQELPADHLNLRTQQEYTLDEARDLLNQHLLARGYTMLRQGEVLRVVNLDKLDPALVPYVAPTDLDTCDPHEFVQTTFELDWIPAATAEEELKPLLSPKGKLTKLSTTNRLHAIDAVANLRSVQQLLSEEQSGRGQERLVRSFPLKFARADVVKASLEELLGLEKPKGPAMPGDPNQMRMMQEQMRQMQQQQHQQQQNQAGKTATPNKEQETSIIANPRDNQIIATAAPETMQIIEKTIELLDAPPPDRGGFDTQLRRMEAYRLAEIDAEVLATMLQDMGGLSPETKVTPDKKNRSLIVNGPMVDHYIVQQIIKKLDGYDRGFKVIRLRRLPADYVAGTIQFMMGPEEKKENNRRDYFFYGYGGRNNDNEEPEKGRFRVDADVQNNRLMIYANAIEMEEIQDLLVQLGEIRPADDTEATVRVLDLSEERAGEFLKQLEKHWQADKTHPLIIEPSTKEQESNSAPAAPGGTPPRDPFTPKGPTTNRSSTEGANSPTAGPGPSEVQNMTIAFQANSEVAPPRFPNDHSGDEIDDAPPTPGPLANPPGAHTPVVIRRGPDGRLIVRSDDPAALNTIEDLVYQLLPPPKDFHVFHLKSPSTYAYDVVWNLEDYFGTDESDSDDNDFRSWYWGGYGNNSSDKDDSLRLSQRKELKFIADDVSRTILVQGASPEQLKIIEELIQLYDQPQSPNSGDLRVTRIYGIKHSKAETVANAIKDVYRDLLSVNDRALQTAGGDKNGQQRPVAERSYTYVLGGGQDRGQPESPIKFKGLISIGIDAESNTLVVSASQSLIGDIEELIESLDTAAKQQEAVSVVRTAGGGVPRDLSQKLKEIFGDKVTIVGSKSDPAAPTESSVSHAPTSTPSTASAPNNPK